MIIEDRTQTVPQQTPLVSSVDTPTTDVAGVLQDVNNPGLVTGAQQTVETVTPVTKRKRSDLITIPSPKWF